jgi:23S rRNA pseudouridine1911/1915/1917 synthase
MVKVLYEDNHLLVLDKPPGVPTQPPPQGGVSLEEEAKGFIKQRDQKPGAVYLHAVHRLDTPVGGIVIFAKTSKALSRLQSALREQKIEKIYQGWVEGEVLPHEGVLKHYLVHGDKRAIKGTSCQKEAKLAVLHYQVLEEKEGLTHLKIALETGRYHQIRAQWSFEGHPIWGDKKYGSVILYPHEGIALAHVECSFPHPVKGTMVHIKLHPLHIMT